MFLVNTIVALAALATCSQLNPNEKRQSSDMSYTYDGPLVPQFNISIPVDHFNKSDTRTYNNRYWVNDTFYQSGGPVFFYDYGLLGISDQDAATALADLNGSTAVMSLARQYHGLAILWEHRYYGLSHPVPFESNYSTGGAPQVQPEDTPEGWSYLTIDQALEDVAYFANNIESGAYQKANVSALVPSNTPWIWIGGLYGGARGAWARRRNPEVIYATWSSSAPVEAIYDGSTFYNEIERSLYSNCSTDTRAVVAYVDQILAGDPTSQEYKDLQRYMFMAAYVGWASVLYNGSETDYNLTDADSLTPLQMATTLSLPFAVWNEIFGPSMAQDLYCDILESFEPGVPGNITRDPYISVMFNPGHGKPSAEGIVAGNGNNLTIGLQAMSFAVAQYWNLGWTVLSPLVETEPAPDGLADGAAGSYQMATQLGWYLASNPDNVTIVSKYYNYTALHDFIVPFTFSQATLDVLPAQPDVAAANKFGGNTMNPSNVMFTAGEYDPWRAASVLSREQNSPGNQPTTEIPTCGKSPANGTRYGAIYPNIGSTSDLRVFEIMDKYSIDSQGNTPPQAGLELFTAALDEWLKCFNGSGGGGNGTGVAPFTGQAPGGIIPGWKMMGTIFTVVVATMLL